MYLEFFFSYSTFLIAYSRYVETGEFLAEVKFGGKLKVDWFHFPSKHFCAVLIFTCSCGVLPSIFGDELDFVVGDSQIHRQEIYFLLPPGRSNSKPHITSLYCLNNFCCRIWNLFSTL